MKSCWNYTQRRKSEYLKVLITGSTGFAGSHLADYIIDNNLAEVHGIRRPRSREEFTRPEVTYHEADITDLASLLSLFAMVQPNIIFHLAAQSFVPLSWLAPVSTFQANAVGTLNVLEAARNACPNAIVQVAGTSEEYGAVVTTECPITEHQPLRPLSPYGVSKVSTDLMAQQYYASYNLKTVITRAFNHTGPRRGEKFVTSKIARQCALIKQGFSEPILRLGNLDAVRDFTDVRDMVRAYWIAANSGFYGTPFNIGTGTGFSIGTVAEMLIQISGKDIKIVRDVDMFRPSDVPLLVCDASLFRIRTGWRPEYQFQQTMKDLFDYWMEKL
jgi:GDP-4-dehydro-6-deoxy-D-mannose reductase